MKVGLIGCGLLGSSVHLPNLRRLRGVQVAAIADPDAGPRNRALRAVPQAVAYALGEELLEQEDLDGVVIATPPATHAQLARKAREQGVSAYLEKPLAVNESEGRLLAESYGGEGPGLMMGFNFRFSSVFQELHELLSRGAAGEVRLARSIFSTGPGQGAGSGSLEWESDVLWELGSHHFDLIAFLFNSPIVGVTGSGEAQSFSVSEKGRPATLKTAILNLKLQSGVIVQSFLASDAGLENRIEVFGALAGLVADRFRSLRVEIIPPRRRIWDYVGGFRAAAGSVARLPAFFARLRTTWGDPSYARALEHFTDSLRSGRPLKPDAGDGLRCIRMVNAAREAIRKTDAVGS